MVRTAFGAWSELLFSIKIMHGTSSRTAYSNSEVITPKSIVSDMVDLLPADVFYWRFVPAPPSGKFDHIYTDAELYEAFNLPQKYIDVIEAVIKERK